MGNISVKSFKLGPIVQEMLFKEKFKHIRGRAPDKDPSQLMILIVTTMAVNMLT